MTAETRDQLRSQLIEHEGIRLRLYKCPANFWTLGVGRNVEVNGISESEARFMLDNDIAHVLDQCSNRLPWFDALDPVRQRAVADLVFNMGLKTFLTFKRTLAAFAEKDYGAAAAHLVESAWYNQVGLRAKRIVAMVGTGTDPGYGRMGNAEGV